MINAFKQSVATNWKEELQLLEDLWRNFNHDMRNGSNYLSDDELEYWNAICSALLPLTEKNYNEIRLKDQFALECERRNPSPFELLKKSESN